MPPSNLHGLARAGVSVWSDQISKRMLDDGELARRVETDAVTGVTSNPTIFANAIVGSDDYASALIELQAQSVAPEDIVKSLMAEDISRACDVLLPVHQGTDGSDGFVSVEVSPTLADNTGATVAEAREWVARIDRPNLLVKVPATPAGIPAIRTLIGEGISVNVTLIFSLNRYSEVIDAYLSGLEDLSASGGDPSRVASVASFFVSRFDSEVDRRLGAIGSEAALSLAGRTAVANARLAYATYLAHFTSSRFTSISQARPQKPLWASTSTKNPDYYDLLYVEDLVAAGTVNTMPIETIEAYQDHGNPTPERFGRIEIEQARVDIDRLGDLGIDYDDVVTTLEREGVEKFEASWQDLLDKVSER